MLNVENRIPSWQRIHIELVAEAQNRLWSMHKLWRTQRRSDLGAISTELILHTDIETVTNTVEPVENATPRIRAIVYVASIAANNCDLHRRQHSL